ncbi:acetylcholine receptor subunit epsilon [Latimeria chalumnae]|uniref:acetylcholine receptor subunit epsilon n=1 Tax=Latimeria chalumnae TaxID=7897 RepID=UPI0006D90EF0|nr:PREDICTED: acetylcholine receptor subunit epsilon [Latimeria chalumnae]|eukprot:XP_014346135.1 PREDICTED: acetylcholine receptor subunit epsilon [Latimeria chalumnae]
MKLTFSLLLLFLFKAVCGNLETKLIEGLFAGYDKSTRPAENVDDIVDVMLKLTLTNLISLNEKEETLTTNVWIEIQWHDYRLTWNTTEFPIFVIRVPYYVLWLPNIVLENNIDGNFDIAYYANVLVYPDGSIYWLPPAIYRSTCSITITFFPFDWQNCSLVFRSQSYSASEIRLLLAVENSTEIEWVDIDPSDFTENGEWAIKHKPARKVINKQFTPDDLEYQEIQFYLIIQRKPLFYIINIIIPCVLISSLVVLVYFLPAQAGGQKCTVSISVLLAQTVFLFLIAQKVPETSLSVPLIGKYIIFVMFVSTLIVTNCVIVLNISLRSPSTHIMPPKVKHIFLEVLPQYLGMHLEPSEDSWDVPRPRRRSSFGIMLKAEEYILKKPRSELMFERQKDRHGLKLSHYNKLDGIDVGTTANLYKSLAHLAPEIKECVDACNFIAKNTKENNDSGPEIESWVLIGKVIDKVCFWVAILLFSIGSVGIFMMGKLNEVPEYPFPGEIKKYTPE